ncbi:related to heat shock factor protein 4 [Lichtheimia corymbifera JMRC:FSU:9682]|uniref:Related to heat shock factor protein 4 n=1 Tax=Lichtheimia corymbifera JMRC:FSU:9682 TaxID=1263082 RepID=A0A068S5E8_9FUNG|nr:related to heat shock factor protein 4 [Lichtheimia corymbifera JMRC:FSU:9682]
MQQAPGIATSPLSWNQHPVISNTTTGSVSSSSPINSPMASPLHSPCDSPREQLHSQFARQVSLQPPPATSNTPSSSQTSTKPGSGNTFVHKLFNMVGDRQYQHLITWTYTGTSFIVCNITEFSRDVLPKHFKHNNFSSFVRQLNMYGFHKVNKSPRGHRALAENQIWEFSHSKFLRGRGDLLDEIKRKALETDTGRRDQNDLNTQMAVMQVAQSDMMQQLAHLQENFSQVVRELADTRRRQQSQQQMLKQMLQHMTQQQGASLQIPADFTALDIKAEPEQSQQQSSQQPPPIYVTFPQNVYHQQQQQQHAPSSLHSPSSPNHHHHDQSLPSRPAVPLTVQTQNLAPSQSSHHTTATTPSHSSMMTAAINTPLPPSPSPSAFLSDDEGFYGPHSPHTPNAMQRSISNNSSSSHLMPAENFMLQQQQQTQQQFSPPMHQSHDPSYSNQYHYHS